MRPRRGGAAPRPPRIHGRAPPPPGGGGGNGGAGPSGAAEGVRRRAALLGGVAAAGGVVLPGAAPPPAEAFILLPGRLHNRYYLTVSGAGPPARPARRSRWRRSVAEIPRKT